MLDLGAKMTYLSQVFFHKNLLKRFKSSQMFILGPKIPNILHFGHNEDFL